MKDKKMLWLLFLAVGMGTGYVGYSVAEAINEGGVLFVSTNGCDPDPGPDPDPNPGDGPGNGDSMPSKLMVS